VFVAWGKGQGWSLPEWCPLYPALPANISLTCKLLTSQKDSSLLIMAFKVLLCRPHVQIVLHFRRQHLEKKII
jgi:hypothetical protein